MANLFYFTDTPETDDYWETKLDTDILSHTRPLLIAQRDRFALAFGSSLAQTELQAAIENGLNDYALHHFPKLQKLVETLVDDFCGAAFSDAIQTYYAWIYELDLTKEIEPRAQQLLHQTLDSPETIARFTQQLLLKLHTLDPMQRLHEIYLLRAPHIASLIPYSTQATRLLTEYFLNDCPILALRRQAPEKKPAINCLPRVLLVEAIFNDVIHAFIKRLETNTEFLDQLLKDWVLPQLHDHYTQLDATFEKLANKPGSETHREIFLYHNTADPEWLQLAELHGAPLPHPFESITFH